MFENIRLLPGRGILRRRHRHYGYGEMLLAPGTQLAGRQVAFSRAEATFQKGNSYYAIVLIRNCETMD